MCNPALFFTPYQPESSASPVNASVRALGLRCGPRALKRGFDIVVSIVGLCLTWWIIILGIVAATIDTRKNGLFMQQRIGRHGRPFTLLKLRTMHNCTMVFTTVTVSGDPRITRLGAFFRRTKLDELPQLLNVLVGQMSFVGPRPDVPGYADTLVGQDRVILAVRPGITGPATLKYRSEEEMLAASDDPVRLNREVIYPDKIRINRLYVMEYSFIKDLGYLLQTVLGR
jgi:lipopolysaccharide/colanic/teichoic acid biosynthesis glycosyltransferase